MDIKKTIPWKFCKYIYYTIYYFPKYDYRPEGHLKHFGRDFPEKTFYVIRQNNLVGLLNYVNYAMDHIFLAFSKGYVPVVNMENYALHLRHKEPINVGGVSTRNAWEYFFEQPCGYSLKDIKGARNVVLGDSQHPHIGTIIKSNTMYKNETDMLRYIYFITYYCKINHTTMEYLNKTKESLFIGKSNILGILYRVLGFKETKGTNIPASMDQMIEQISQVLYKENFDYIYICTEVHEMVDELYKSFPKDKIICLTRERFREDNWILTYESIYKKRTQYQLELDYLTDVYLLSQCDGLIASNANNGLFFSLAINNNKYRYKYIFDLGDY
jgi:hypothetical protein